MKAVILVFMVQLFIAVTIAQITFTREWVTGKRSSNPAVVAAEGAVKSHLVPATCQSTKLYPAIKYLIDIENALQESCRLQQQQLKHQIFHAGGGSVSGGSNSQDGSAAVPIGNEFTVTES